VKVIATFDKKVVLQSCKKTIKIGTNCEPPSPKCRRAVEASDVACICRILSIKEQRYVSAVKLVDLAADCGKPVPAGNKCGGKYLTLFIIL
jgi:hypothetical protein